MADNVSVVAGIYTATIAADDIGGIHYQRAKAVWGVDGVATDTSAAAPLPVTDGGAASFDHGSNRDIDVSAEQIIVASTPALRGVWVKADANNTGRVYLGNSDVTAGTTDATDGWALDGGEEVLIRVNNANLIYAIADVVNQIIYWRTE